MHAATCDGASVFRCAQQTRQLTSSMTSSEEADFAGERFKANDCWMRRAGDDINDTGAGVESDRNESASSEAGGAHCTGVPAHFPVKYHTKSLLSPNIIILPPASTALKNPWPAIATPTARAWEASLSGAAHSSHAHHCTNSSAVN